MRLLTMPKQPKSVVVARCSCGAVEFEAVGAPIMSLACHCADCHEGSRRIEAFANASPVLDSYGGTPYLLYRKDRIKPSKGAQVFKRFKVEEDSPNRVYASCCNSFLFIDLDNPMHWVPMHRGRFQGEVPSIQMRINAKFKPETKDVPSDVPVFSSFPFRFIAKLIGAKLAMVFHC